MKYRTKSAEALNEADRFQRILDWQLFAMEQNNQLFGYNPDVDWAPGDPMYAHPRDRNDFAYDHRWTDFEMEEGPLGNCTRFMIDEFDDGSDYQYVKCKPCGVSWGADEDSCWMCGEVYEKPARWLFKGTSFGGNTDLLVPLRILRSEIREDGLHVTMDFNGEQFEHQARVNQEQFAAMWRALNPPMQAFSLGLRRAGRAMNEFSNHIHSTMRGMQSQFAIYDEWIPRGFHNVRYNEGGVARYVPPVRPTNPFVREEREIELVPPVVPNLPEWREWGTPPFINLPADWAELRPTVPVPELPERPLIREDDPYWVRMGPDDPWRNR